MSEAVDLEGGLAALDGLGVSSGRVGESDSDTGPGLELDGHSLEGCPLVRPGDSQALARSLAILSEHHLAALVRGGGSQLGIGNPPKKIDVVLDTRSLSGVNDFEQEDGVVSVRAGTSLSLLREQVGPRSYSIRP